MFVELTAAIDRFNAREIEALLARHGVAVEPREISTASGIAIKYLARLSAWTSIEDVNAELMAGGAIISAAWSHAKRERA
jgi:hypothetical protein